MLSNTIQRPVCAISFGPKKVLLAGGSGGYELWDLAAGSHAELASHSLKYHYGCRCEPRGRWAYCADNVGGFRIVPFGRQAPRLPNPELRRHVTSFDLSADGSRLVMNHGGAGMNRVECWNVSPKGALAPVWCLLDGKSIDPEKSVYLNDADWSTNSVAISRDANRVVTAESRSLGTSGNKPLLVLRDAANGKLRCELGKSSTDFTGQPAFAAGGEAVYFWDGSLLERWDLKAARRSHHVPTPGRGYFSGLCVPPTGKFVITVSGDGQARYWDANDLSLVRTLKCGIGKLHAVALSQDGKLAAAGGEKGRIAVWHVDSEGDGEDA